MHYDIKKKGSDCRDEQKCEEAILIMVLSSVYIFYISAKSGLLNGYSN